MSTTPEHTTRSPAVPGSAAAAESRVEAGTLFKSDAGKVVYRERFTPREAHLHLSCGEFEALPRTESRSWCFPREESLLFMWRGQIEVLLGERTYKLAAYDTLYIPHSAPFRLSNPSPTPARLVHCSAPATGLHPAFHSRFEE